LQVYKLPTGQLYATYFGGDETLKLEPDLDAKTIWLKYLPESRVLPFGCKVTRRQLAERAGLQSSSSRAFGFMLPKLVQSSCSLRI
jgi:hypothetical protein